MAIRRESRCKNHGLSLSLPLVSKPTNTRTQPSCVISGGTQGLGKAIAARMLQHGYKVIVGGRNRTRGRESVNELLKYSRSECKEQVMFFPLDLEETNSVQEFAKRCKKELGNIDVLFNNAAICLYSNKLEAAKRSFKVNVQGTYELTRLLVLETQQREHPSPAIVVNLSSSEGELSYLYSILAQDMMNASCGEEVEEVFCILRKLIDQFDPEIEYAFGPSPFYSVAKAALNAITQILANLDPLATSYVVHSVCPGDVMTSMVTRGQESEAKEPMIAAEDVIWLALDPPRIVCCGSADGISNFATGGFWRKRKRIKF